MAIYKVTPEALVLLPGTQLAAEGILERRDLQRLLRGNIQALDPDLMVITEEFDQWVDSARRIDLLCLDREARLVVVELKRSDDGGYMELQALRYAAMVSTMTFGQLVEAYKSHLVRMGTASDNAEQDILSFLQWDSPENELSDSVRLILAAADFSKELTTSVLWLNKQGVEISCVRLKPYRYSDGTVLLDIQQLIPLPEAAAYQTQIRVKEKVSQAQTAQRYELRYSFWVELLPYAKSKTDLHANRGPSRYHWIGGSLGKPGFQLNYVVRGEDSQVELYIDLGAESDDRNLRALNWLKQHQQSVEASFGEPLEWQDLPESRSCRICKVIQGGYRSPRSEWPQIHANMVDAMIRLDAALRPLVSQVPTD